MQVINPATEAVIAELQEDSSSSINEKSTTLQQGQPAWAAHTLGERIAIVNRFSSLLQANIEQLAGVLTSEVGKPLQQSRNEINGGCARITWLAEHAEQYLANETMSLQPGLEETIIYEPLGVVCNISAWNYPYLVGINVFVPALLAGNAVMYKPSEYATLTGIEIQRLLWQAGVPENVFQLAAGGGAVGAQLLEMPFDGYFFTGSYATGQHIYKTVAHKMVPCQCEMGGKDPLYVADDILDIAAVAAATADGAFYNNGQSCCAVERIYVHEKVYDAFVAAFTNEVQSYKMGDPRETSTYIGPVSRRAQLDVLQAQVADAIHQGATLLAGGSKVNTTGYYFAPTVLTNVNHDMQVMQQETFGPLIGIMKVKDDEEAMGLMKDTEYGLTASVYSGNKERALSILNRLDTGSGYWNCCDRVSAALPWSGRKHSGFGATLSHAGIRAFTKPKGLHLKG